MREPVAISVALGGVLSTAVAMAAVLWPERLTPEITVAIIALGNALISFGVALFARARVTPLASPSLAHGSSVTVTGDDGEPIMVQRLV